MIRILVINGPNLARLGLRKPEVYGSITLAALESSLRAHTKSRGIELTFCQSDVEGHLIEFVNANREADGIVLNPGALTMSGWSLRECLEDFDGLIYEVHISQVFAREPFRHESVTAPVADAYLCGLGIDGYRVAIDALVENVVRQRDDS